MEHFLMHINKEEAILGLLIIVIIGSLIVSIIRGAWKVTKWLVLAFIVYLIINFITHIKI